MARQHFGLRIPMFRKNFPLSSSCSHREILNRTKIYCRIRIGRFARDPSSELARRYQMPQIAGNSNRERGKHRTACQPCSQRKVRCDREVEQPCSNYVRRNKPELCDLGPASHSRAQPHRSGGRKTASAAAQPPTSSRLTTVERDHGVLTSQPNNQEFLRTPASVVPTAESQQQPEAGSLRLDVLPRLDPSPDRQYQSPVPPDGAPTPSHIGEPSMAIFIRHQCYDPLHEDTN